MHGENEPLNDEKRGDSAGDSGNPRADLVGEQTAIAGDGQPHLGDAVSPARPVDQPAGLPIKVCRHCSVQSQTDGSFCPNCGKSFVRSNTRRSGKFRLLALSAVAIVILAGGVTAVSLVVAHNNEVAAEQRAADKAEAAEAADAAHAAAREKSRKAADVADRAERKTTVSAIETSITTDAQTQVDSGELDGPIIKSSCAPLGGGSTDDLTALTTTFTCIAINVENADGTASGYRFSATMNWDTGSYTWHLGD
jgi:hypothetical protein